LLHRIGVERGERPALAGIQLQASLHHLHHHAARVLLEAPPQSFVGGQKPDDPFDIVLTHALLPVAAPARKDRRAATCDRDQKRYVNPRDARSIQIGFAWPLEESPSWSLEGKATSSRKSARSPHCDARARLVPPPKFSANIVCASPS